MDAKELKGRVENEINQLAEQVDQERKGARFAEILDNMAKFHKYSFNNSILIHLQRPDARRVAGFHTWKSLGRYVKKGEKGIMILAPLIYKKALQENIPDESEQKEVQVLRGFRAVVVFDISQTEGKELESFQYQELASAPSALLDKAKQIASSRGYAVNIVPSLGGPLGCCDNISKEIKIVSGSTEQMFTVLIHELGHALLEHAGGQHKFQELEAESVAYVVCRYLGLQPKNVDYLLSYQATKDDILKILENVQKIAQDIISKISE